MNQHCIFYEQFCWVMQKNIVLEETFFHNGKRSLRCTHDNECALLNGCQNTLMQKVIADTNQARREA